MPFSWKTVPVFISSTFRDMQAERDWLVRFVFPKLREELLKYRLHFVDVDLRWGVTSDQDALGVCRDVIDECRPRFLCLLGGRYGWIPEGSPESITANEVHYGVLDREAEENGHAFFYFRDESATAMMVEESPGEFRESIGSANAIRLADLKEDIVEAGLPIFTYPAQWDATQNRLVGLEAFGHQVYTDLLESFKNEESLGARFKGEGSGPVDEFAEELEQMEAFIEERTERYVIGSREPQLGKMLSFAAGNGTPNIFVLTGEPGSGKSALLAKFTRDLALLHPTAFIFPNFVGASRGSTDLRGTLRRLCHEIAQVTGRAEPLPLDIRDLITHFQKLLAEAAHRQRVILVIDALNQFDATDSAHSLNWLPRELPPGVRVVVSVTAPGDGQPEHQTLAALRTRPGILVEELENLTRADMLDIVEGYLRRYAKRLSPEQITALLDKPGGGLPLYVLTALEELRTLGTYHEITARILALPGDASALFGWILTERLDRDPGFRDQEGRPCGAALVEKFSACLGVSRHGLSPAEITALLDPGDLLGNAAALLRLLRPYLMRRGELLDFYHSQFREAALSEYLPTDSHRQAAHQDLVTFFDRQLLSWRKAAELPWQLRRVNEKGRLKECLLDLAMFLLMHELDQNEIIGYWVWLGEERTMGSQYRDAFERWGANEGGIERNQSNEEHVASTLGNFLFYSGLPEDAEPLLRRALALSEWRLPAIGPEVATMLNNLARLLAQSDRFEEARDCYYRALELYENSYGPNHPAVATCVSNLGQVLMELGQIADAEDCLRLSLSIDEEAYGQDSTMAGRDLVNLAGVFKETQRFTEAGELYRQALAIHESRLGPDHPDLAIALGNYGLFLNDEGRSGEAEPLLRRALQITELIFGSNHPSVALCLNNLADVLGELDRPDEAESLLRRALEIDEASFGREGQPLAMRLNNLGNCLQRAGKTGEAEACLRRALAIQERHLGLEHRESSTILNSLAGILHTTGRYEESESMFRRALENDEAFFGPDHPRVAIRLANLGLLLGDTGRLDEAEELLERHLAISEKIHGPDHPKTADALRAMVLFQKKSRAPQVHSLLQRIVEIDEKNLGGDSRRIVGDLVELAQARQEAGAFEEAEHAFRQALEVLETTRGMEDLSLARVLNHLGLLLQRERRAQEAEVHLRRARDIEQGNPAADQLGLAATLNNLSLVLIDQGKMEEAEDAARRSLAIGESTESKGLATSASALNKLGMILFRTGRLEEAESACRESLQINLREDRVPGVWSAELANEVNNYCGLLERQGHSLPTVYRLLSSLFGGTSTSGKQIQLDSTPTGALGTAYLERGLWRQLFKLVHLGPGKAVACPARVVIAANLVFESVAYPDSLRDMASRFAETGIRGVNRVPYEVPSKRILAFCSLDLSPFSAVIGTMEKLSLLTPYAEGGAYRPGMSIGDGTLMEMMEGRIVPKRHFWEVETKMYGDFFRLLEEFVELDPDFIDKSEGEFDQLREQDYTQRLGFIDGCMRAAKNATAAPILKSGEMFLPVLRDFFPDHGFTLELFHLLVSEMDDGCMTMEDLARLREDPQIREIREAFPKNPTSGGDREALVKDFSQRIRNVLELSTPSRSALQDSSCVVDLKDRGWPNSQVDALPCPTEWGRQIRIPVVPGRNMLIFAARTPQGLSYIGYSLRLFDTY